MDAMKIEDPGDELCHLETSVSRSNVILLS